MILKRKREKTMNKKMQLIKITKVKISKKSQMRYLMTQQTIKLKIKFLREMIIKQNSKLMLH